MSKMIINNQEIDYVVESAMCSIWELASMVYQLMDEEITLCEYIEDLNKFVSFIHGMKQPMKDALHKYDDLAALAAQSA